MDWIKQIWELLLLYKEEIAFVLAVLTLSEERIRAIAVSLMLQAEKLAKEAIIEGGPAKMEWVVRELNKRIFKDLIPNAYVKLIAQKWYDWAVKERKR